MTGSLPLNWAATAVSLFNTIVLLWLGLTVLLNAQRRSRGIWLAGGGLLLGGAFFVSHSVILGLGLETVAPSIVDLRFWWYQGLFSAIALPVAWYLMMLWYSSYWDSLATALRRRQRLGMAVVLVLLSGGLVAFLIYANPLPDLVSSQALKARIQNTGGTYLLIVGYAAYLLLCSGLSLDALRRPGPIDRIMGDLARARARGWLVSASLLLLVVSLLVIFVLVWVLANVRQAGAYVITPEVLRRFTQFDLVISLVIAAAVLVLGQAIVAYEIFTGKTLPRRGLGRSWQRAIFLAAGYGLFVGGALTLPLQPAYSVLLATVLMTLFFALLGWRAYAERERYMSQLRPFVASQRLYDQLLTPPATAPPDVDAAGQFQALCRDVLGVRPAYLIPLGPLAPLVGPPFTYPPGTAVSFANLNDIVDRFHSPETISLPLDPGQYQGARWAISLWSERGLIGLLLLGEKTDGSFFSQEEIEIARASGERLVDTQASSEMARRLLALQRQRLAESQVVDRRARRALHDDVLPLLHTAMISLGGDTASKEEVMSLLSDAHRQIADLLRDFPAAVTPQVARLGALGALHRTVEDEFGPAFDRLAWEIDPLLEKETLRLLPPLAGEVLFYAAREAIRNAARHGRGEDATRPLTLRVQGHLDQGGLELVIEDSGIGLTGELDGRGGDGQGLALHSAMMAVIGGTLATETVPSALTRVFLTLPRTAWQLFQQPVSK